MNESLVKYLAGLLDADGSLSFSFKHDPNRCGRYFIGLSLRLTASDEVDHRRFVESLPGETGLGSTSRHGKDNQFVVWNVSKRADLEMLIPRITKHMVIKAKHWDWLFNVWRDMRPNNKTCSITERVALTAASKESRRLRVGPLKPKNHPTWAWLAGYLDGDGWYSYRSGRYASYKGRTYQQWSMSVSAAAHVNDVIVLEFIQNAFGGDITVHDSPSGNVRRWHRSLGYQN